MRWSDSGVMFQCLIVAWAGLRAWPGTDSRVRRTALPSRPTCAAVAAPPCGTVCKRRAAPALPGPGRRLRSHASGCVARRLHAGRAQAAGVDAAGAAVRHCLLPSMRCCARKAMPPRSASTAARCSGADAGPTCRVGPQESWVRAPWRPSSLNDPTPHCAPRRRRSALAPQPPLGGMSPSERLSFSGAEASRTTASVSSRPSPSYALTKC